MFKKLKVIPAFSNNWTLRNLMSKKPKKNYSEKVGIYKINCNKYEECLTCETIQSFNIRFKRQKVLIRKWSFTRDTNENQYYLGIIEIIYMKKW